MLLDGAKIAASGDVAVLVGSAHHQRQPHRLQGRQRSPSRPLPDTAAEATLALARSSAVLTLVTAPADVEVLIDGVSKGKTAAGPPPADFASKAAAAGIPANQLSGVMMLTDLAAGSHRIEFKRACFVQAERRQEISQLDDYVLDPIRLAPAVATLVAQSPQADTTVFVDGESRGRAPYTAEMCEGTHTVELRAATGRYMRRVDAKAGQRVEVSGALRPAFALVASTQTSLNADLRAAIEKAFEPLKSILVFAPPADKLDAALKAEKLPPDWLGYDGNRRPFGVSAEVTAAMRRDLSAKLAKAFDAQGIAAVTAPIANNRSRLVLSLLGAGIAEPDVIEVNLDQQDTVASAVGQIDRALSFLTPTAGLTAIDVADISGPIVASVDANGPAAQAGLQIGDIIVSADGKPLADAAALAAAVSAHTGAQALALEVKDKAATKKADAQGGDAPAPDWHQRPDAVRESHAGDAACAAQRSDRPGRAGIHPPQSRCRADASRVVERCARGTAAGDAHRRTWRRHGHRAVPAGTLRCPPGQPCRCRSGVQGGCGVEQPADRRRPAREGTRRSAARGADPRHVGAVNCQTHLRIGSRLT